MLPHALLLVCFIAGGALAQECDDNTYLQCQANLNAALNLTDNRPYANPQTFRYNVELFYQNSPTTGLRTVCRAFRQFKQCMGANYGICMTPTHFVGIGSSPFNAYIFISTFNTMHYTCGGGFQIFLSNAACMANAWKGASSEQLNACRFKYEVTSNSTQDSACSLANTYLNCWEQQILSVCGSTSRDTQFWGCEYARINAFTRFPACPTTCVLPHNGGVIG